MQTGQTGQAQELDAAMLALQRGGAIDPVGHGVAIQSPVGDQSINATPLVLHLPHHLLEAGIELTDQICDRDAHGVEVDALELLRELSNLACADSPPVDFDHW